MPWEAVLEPTRTNLGFCLVRSLEPGHGTKASTKNFQLPSYQGNDHYQPLFFSETTSYGYYLFN